MQYHKVCSLEYVAVQTQVQKSVTLIKKKKDKGHTFRYIGYMGQSQVFNQTISTQCHVLGILLTAFTSQ